MILFSLPTRTEKRYRFRYRLGNYKQAWRDLDSVSRWVARGFCQRTVNPWLIGRNGESLPPGCQMKAYALVPALEGRVARMAKLADPPDLGFRNRRFHNVPLRFHRSPIYGRKTRFFNYQSRVDDRFDRAVWNRCVSCNCICD